MSTQSFVVFILGGADMAFLVGVIYYAGRLVGTIEQRLRNIERQISEIKHALERRGVMRADAKMSDGYR